MRWVLAAMLAIGTPGTAMAQDRLAPTRIRTDAVSRNYDNDIRKVLSEAWNDDVVARVVVLPSFSAERAIGIRRNGHGYEVFGLSSGTDLWDFQSLAMIRNGQEGVMKSDGRDGSEDVIKQLKARLPGRIEDVQVDRCTAQLPDDVAQAILNAWQIMLEGVHQNDLPAIGVDGTSYHFSMQVAGHELTGQAWSPPDDSRDGKLVTLVEWMLAYCHENDKQGAKAIAALARTIAIGGRGKVGVPAIAWDHLEPLDASVPPLGDSNLRHIFHEAFDPRVVARLILAPRDAPETAIGLRRSADGYELFSLTSGVQIQSYADLADMEGLEAAFPPVPGEKPVANPPAIERGLAEFDRKLAKLRASLPKIEEVKVVRCVVPIDGEVAQAIVAAWRPMLAGAHAPLEPTNFRTDTQLTFSMSTEQGGIDAASRLPLQNSRVRRLAQLAFAMRDFCRHGGRNEATRLAVLARQVSGAR